MHRASVHSGRTVTVRVYSAILANDLLLVGASRKRLINREAVMPVVGYWQLILLFVCRSSCVELKT